MKLEGIYESAMAPIIARELGRHPGAYIKSHPRGVREGVSRIELDIAVIGEEKDRADAEGEEIARDMTGAIVASGGRITWSRGQKAVRP